MLGFLRFIFDCLMNAIGTVVGSVYDTDYDRMTSLHGSVAGLIWLISTVIFILIFGLDYEKRPKHEWSIPVASIISVIIVIIYLAAIYFF